MRLTLSLVTCRLWRAAASVRRMRSATAMRSNVARPDRPDVLASQVALSGIKRFRMQNAQVITVSLACPDLPASEESQALHHRCTSDPPRTVAVALAVHLARLVSAVPPAILDNLATTASPAILVDQATLASKDLPASTIRSLHN